MHLAVSLLLTVLGSQLLSSCGDETAKKKKTGTSSISTDTDNSPEATACLIDCSSENAVAGKNFFISKVNPQLQKTCVTCHAEPRIQVEQRGPLTIFNYEKMVSKVNKAEWRESELFAILNDETHGGNYYKSETEVIPLVLQWREIQFGFVANKDTDATGTSGIATFKLVDVSGAGSVSGYAKHPTDSSQILEVSLYLDGDNTTGKLLGKAPANLAAKLFRFTLDAATRDGCQHKISAYANVDGTLKQLEGSPLDFRAYKPTATAEWNATKAAFDASCSASNCHGNGSVDSRTQAGLFNMMMDPNPGKGTTAEKSQLYLKASGGVTHFGGNRCGGGGGPCQQIAAWFNKEIKQCPTP